MQLLWYTCQIYNALQRDLATFVGGMGDLSDWTPSGRSHARARRVMYISSKIDRAPDSKNDHLLRSLWEMWRVLYRKLMTPY